MPKVVVLQTDNRPSLHYLLKTQEVNKTYCEILGYDYKFIYLDNHYNVDHKTAKLYIVNKFLENSEDDILIFLDSDAWIQNGEWLHNIINRVMNDHNKVGCFSRDPYVQKNTFINSGSFILKINEWTKQFYRDCVMKLENDLKMGIFNKYGWEDQYYISNYVFDNKDKFYIFVPDILNTPLGKVLRHNWCKNQKMYDDLHELLCYLKQEVLEQEKNSIHNISYSIEDHYDKENFPNTIENGYEYFE